MFYFITGALVEGFVTALFLVLILDCRHIPAAYILMIAQIVISEIINNGIIAVENQGLWSVVFLVIWNIMLVFLFRWKNVHDLVLIFTMNAFRNFMFSALGNGTIALLGSVWHRISHQTRDEIFCKSRDMILSDLVIYVIACLVVFWVTWFAGKWFIRVLGTISGKWDGIIFLCFILLPLVMQCVTEAFATFDEFYLTGYSLYMILNLIYFLFLIIWQVNIWHSEKMMMKALLQRQRKEYWEMKRLQELVRMQNHDLRNYLAFGGSESGEKILRDCRKIREELE